MRLIETRDSVGDLYCPTHHMVRIMHMSTTFRHSLLAGFFALAPLASCGVALINDNSANASSSIKTQAVSSIMLGKREASRINIPKIVGPIVGVVVGLVLVGAACFVALNRRRHTQATDINRYATHSPQRPRLSFYPKRKTRVVDSKWRQTKTSSFRSPMPEKFEFSPHELPGVAYQPHSPLSASSSKGPDSATWPRTPPTNRTPIYDLNATSGDDDRDDAASTSMPLTPLAPAFDALMGSQRNSVATVASQHSSLGNRLKAALPSILGQGKRLPPLPIASPEAEPKLVDKRPRPSPLDSSRFNQQKNVDAVIIPSSSTTPTFAVPADKPIPDLASPANFPLSADYATNMSPPSSSTQPLLSPPLSQVLISPSLSPISKQTTSLPHELHGRTKGSVRRLPTTPTQPNPSGNSSPGIGQDPALSPSSSVRRNVRPLPVPQSPPIGS
ncbi:hypothetical protein DL96DRAFT_1605226 [Flagelloscypha sp. PMI_526]|nr:hypothetical protein DL96DRAFT_1605226 [Flagelloscypha sp. PMI_526]